MTLCVNSNVTLRLMLCGLPLKDKLGSTFATKLRELTIKFDTFKKCGNVLLHLHLRKMPNMIYDLEIASHILTDEQKMQAVVHSLPNSREHMKVNENIRTFDDIFRHLELEKGRLDATKSSKKAFVAKSSMARASHFKCKKNNNGSKICKKKRLGNHENHGICIFHKCDMKNMNKIKRINCNKKDYLSHDCTEPKKFYPKPFSYDLFFSNSFFLVESKPM